MCVKPTNKQPPGLFQKLNKQSQHHQHTINIPSPNNHKTINNQIISLSPWIGRWRCFQKLMGVHRHFGLHRWLGPLKWTDLGSGNGQVWYTLPGTFLQETTEKLWARLGLANKGENKAYNYADNTDTSEFNQNWCSGASSNFVSKVWIYTVYMVNITDVTAERTCESRLIGNPRVDLCVRFWFTGYQEGKSCLGRGPTFLSLINLLHLRFGPSRLRALPWLWNCAKVIWTCWTFMSLCLSSDQRPDDQRSPKEKWLNDKSSVFTLPETNIAPQNGWVEDEFRFGMAYFQGLCYF